MKEQPVNRLLIDCKENKMEDIMAEFVLEQHPLGLLATNCYILINNTTKDTIIIDPGAQADQLALLYEQKGLRVIAILLTHGHADHIGGVDELKKLTGALVYCHRDEQQIISNPDLNGSRMMGLNSICKVDMWLEGNETLELCGMSFKVIHTPGHTIGSVCYYLAKENVLISGDTLFAKTCGRTDFPTGSMDSIVRSIKEKLFILPDETKVYPGHGESTTIGYEKENNMIASL